MIFEGKFWRHMARCIAVLIAFIIFAPSRPALAADAGAEARYQALLTAAKAGDQPVDWQALRFAYADSPGFSVFSDGQEVARKAMFQAFNTGDFTTALAQAKLILEHDYVDIDAHAVAFMAYNKLGQSADAQRERAAALGLARSIETGDGKTDATAFTVIRVSEEYSLMRVHGRRVVRQALIHHNGHSYDLLSTVDGAGAAQDYYFQIDRVWAAEGALFKPKTSP